MTLFADTASAAQTAQDVAAVPWHTWFAIFIVASGVVTMALIALRLRRAHSEWTREYNSSDEGRAQITKVVDEARLSKPFRDAVTDYAREFALTVEMETIVDRRVLHKLDNRDTPIKLALDQLVKQMEKLTDLFEVMRAEIAKDRADTRDMERELRRRIEELKT